MTKRTQKTKTSNAKSKSPEKSELENKSGSEKETVNQPLRKLRNSLKKDSFEPKNESQKRFLESIEENDIVFNIGSAGSGKTYAAVSYAIKALVDRQSPYKRLVLVRPAMEAGGERIGFLPGEKEDKMSPYMQPVYDVLGDYNLTRKDIEILIEEEYIEICPLAFMRGRSLNKCLVVIEESQNLSSALMEMLLTRLGNQTKFIFTGDITQRDFDDDRTPPGIEEAMMLFGKVKGIDFIFFQSKEILRHGLVGAVVDSYAALREKEKDKKDKMKEQKMNDANKMIM